MVKKAAGAVMLACVLVVVTVVGSVALRLYSLSGRARRA